LTHLTIAIDAMGGDHGPEVTVPAALQALRDFSQLKLVLVGDKHLLETLLTMHHAKIDDRLSIQHASEQVTMDEAPSQALRNKKDSSMRVAINLVKEGIAQACVSAGNTGALMATARFVLKMLPGIDRPAICTTFPTLKPGKEVHVLDLGANVDSCADHLYQFAVMGSVLASALDNIERPKVGLLNIGQEEIKGNDQVKRTAQLLSESKMINYYGYVEGNDFFSGKVDVIVCDGFVGNVALKTIEGAIKLLSTYAKEEFNRSLFTKLSGLIAMPVLKRFKKRLDPDRQNGASLIGLQGIVIKSHGSASITAFYYAIREAMAEVENNIPERIGHEVSIMLEELHK
jgi:glycerol-3-phosphate acyltransferase PlsX